MPEKEKIKWSIVRAELDRIIQSPDFANRTKSLDILKDVLRAWPGSPKVGNDIPDLDVDSQYRFPLSQFFERRVYDENNDQGAIYKQLVNMCGYLEQFYSAESVPKPFRLAIDVKSTSVTFHVIQNLKTEDWLGEFWGPYAQGSRDNNKLLLSESWFWRNEKHVYIRDFFQNNTANTGWLSEFETATGGHKFHPGLFYMASGQVWAALELSSFFTERGIKLAVASASEYPSPWKLRGLNVVMLGNSRTNACYSLLQQTWRAMRLADMSIVDYRADGTQVELCADDNGIIGPNRHYYALLTRCPNVDATGVITALVANHGHAAQASMEFLTGPNLPRLAEALRVKGWRPAASAVFPSCFQVVFDVTVQTGTKGDETVDVVLRYPRVPGSSLPEGARSA